MGISAKMGKGREKGIASKPWCLLTMSPDARLVWGGFQRESKAAHSLSQCVPRGPRMLTEENGEVPSQTPTCQGQGREK